jgi:hypothetical protein
MSPSVPETIYGESMAKVIRAVLAVFGFVLYVWYAAVRFAPVVKRRKAARRRR